MSRREADGGMLWVRSFDGRSADVDLSGDDDSGNPGLGANEGGLFTITLYSDPIDDVDENTLSTSLDIFVQAGTGTEPTFTTFDFEVPAVGSDDGTVTLTASSAPVGYTAHLYGRSQLAGGSWSAWDELTATPALSAPPTVETVYTFDTSFQRVAKTSPLPPLVRFELSAEIENASATEVYSTSTIRSWYCTGA